jgi:hypothetical protein
MKRKSYIANQVKWLLSYTKAEFRAVREAVTVVAVDSKEKHKAQNEWRAQFKDQANTLATKDAMESMKDNFEKAIRMQAERINELEKKNSNRDGRLWAIGITWAVLIILINLAIRLL